MANKNTSTENLLHEAVRKHPWLKVLLEAYAIIDTGVAEDIARAGRVPACGPGCTACCRQPIPLLPPEVLGLQLFLHELASPETLAALKNPPAPLAEQCFFLLNGTCAAYALRPMICRRFIVFDTRCAYKEIVTDERPQDLLTPSRHVLLHALQKTIPLYNALGIQQTPDQSGLDFFLRQTVLISQVSWEI